MTSKQQQLADLFALAPVIPVVVIDNAALAVPMARALVAGGLPAIEITLRTPAALEAVRAIAQEVEGAVVGVGSVRTPRDFAEAEAAGARFAVSPGSTPGLLAAARDTALPWLPGAATASEAMTLAEAGLVHLKFFPAEAIGGAAALKALAGPLPSLRFCATGGIEPGNAPAYLALRNVPCVGSSWCTPADALASRDWAEIERRARVCAALRRE